MIYKVVWCNGSRKVEGIRAAVRLARGKSARFHAFGGCDGATVWRTRNGADGRERGEAVVVCRDKSCRKTGWLQSR